MNSVCQLTVFNALSVVSSREAARQPSSVDPPSHMPANAAILLQPDRGNIDEVQANNKTLYNMTEM